MVSQAPSALRAHDANAREVFLNERFAMWPLGASAAGLQSLTVAQILAEDRLMQRELAAQWTQSPPPEPVGRLLLPMAAVLSDSQLDYQQLWVDDPAEVEASWTRVLEEALASSLNDQSEKVDAAPPFMALTVFKYESGLLSRTTDIPGSVGTRVLLENAAVKLWDFRVMPKVRCDLHEHLHPHMFINRSACETRGLDAQLQPDGPVTAFRAGDFRFVELGDPMMADRCIHAFENPGTVDVQQYIVEFLS